MRKIRITVPVLVPVALRMPIWRLFWMTETPRTLAMPSATAMMTKVWIITEELLCAFSPARSCWFSLHPALGGAARSRRRGRRAIPSASKTSATFTSMVVMPAGQVEQRLGLAERDQDPALVHVLVPDVEDPRDGEDVAAPLAPSAIRILSPTDDAEVVRRARSR